MVPHPQCVYVQYLCWSLFRHRSRHIQHKHIRIRHYFRPFAIFSVSRFPCIEYERTIFYISFQLTYYQSLKLSKFAPECGFPQTDATFATISKESEIPHSRKIEFMNCIWSVLNGNLHLERFEIGIERSMDGDG